MPTLPASVIATKHTPVPLLDVDRQTHPLRDELLAAVAGVIDSGRFVHGPECQALETAIAAYSRTEHAVGCASGSDALLLALMALEIGPGDEVLLPSFTFFATASAVWRVGAKPVFIDIDPGTFNIDGAQLAAHVTPATKAILPVHLFGACADMAAIGAVADTHGLPIVEDAAQSIGAEFRGRRAGSMGAIGCFSFYPTKNLGCAGDGGMLVTDDARLAERLRKLRDHGMHPRYHHSHVGINSRLDTIQAAILGVKLPHLDRWAALRARNAERYHELLLEAELDEVITLPHAASNCRHVWNQYTIRVPDGRRDALQQALAGDGIGSAVYYPVPLHLQKCFSSLEYRAGSLPETERAAREVLSLPIFPELTIKEQRAVVERIAAFFAESAPAKRHKISQHSHARRGGN
jgi:dTDP-4-amino-4,6-dideoxygalactose transaminase